MTFRDLLHNPSVYPRPEQFQPERWLNANPERLQQMNRYFLPFGKGSRMCLGLQ